MADLNGAIANLMARIAKYENELDAATSAQEKSEMNRLTGLITSRSEFLNWLIRDG